MQYSVKAIISIILNLLLAFQVTGQIPVGSWRDHLPYSNGKTIAIANSRVYCATDLALFYYDKTDNSISKLSKINTLSDLEVGYIAFNDELNKLIIGYVNGNVDIIENDKKYNYPDIKIKNIISDKTIHHILIHNDFAYLSTGFGIVVFNMKKDEFADSYIIGEGGSYMKINNTAIYNNYIYASTDDGVYKGDLDDPFLANFENWEKVNDLLNPNEKYYSSAVFNNKLLLVNSINDTDSCHVNTFDGHAWDTIFTDIKSIKTLSVTGSQLVMAHKESVNVYNTDYESIIKCNVTSANHAIIDDDNIWVARSWAGLKLYNKGIYVTTISPNGPPSKNVFKVYHNNGTMLVAPGGYSDAYYPADVYSFTDNRWSSLRKDANNKDSLKTLLNIVDFASQQNGSQYIAATWGYGAIEVENDKITKIHTKNSTNGILGNYIGGVTYDKNGNLYIVSNYSETPFVVKTSDDKWYHYQYDPDWGDMVLNSSRKLINTYNNDKWTISTRGKGIFVWNDNLTPEYEADDIYKKFALRDDANKVIDNRLNDIVQDVEGVIWIATGNGIAVYDYPQYALIDDRDFYARRPQIVVDGYLKALLEGENVTSIAVDGANRKWLGTESGGLFLVSPDGTEQLMVFNVDNSKLFSNNITSVDINQKTGELFIGTDKGMQSYKSTSTESKNDYSDIFVFPNPVKGDYNGVITIRGLMYETNVKITDLSGHLVFETISNGGDAIWNGKDMTGNKVVSGIYLVLCTNTDGTQSEASKIMFIK